MTTTLELPKNDTQKYEPEEIYRWLQVQSEELGIDMLEKFEVAWNDQEPRPDPPINLLAAKSPE